MGPPPPSKVQKDPYEMETHSVRTRRDLENIYTPPHPAFHFIEEYTEGSSLAHVKKALCDQSRTRK